MQISLKLSELLHALAKKLVSFLHTQPNIPIGVYLRFHCDGGSTSAEQIEKLELGYKILPYLNNTDLKDCIDELKSEFIVCIGDAKLNETGGVTHILLDLFSYYFKDGIINYNPERLDASLKALFDDFQSEYTHTIYYIVRNLELCIPSIGFPGMELKVLDSPLREELLNLAQLRDHGAEYFDIQFGKAVLVSTCSRDDWLNGKLKKDVSNLLLALRLLFGGHIQLTTEFSISSNKVINFGAGMGHHDLPLFTDKVKVQDGDIAKIQEFYSKCCEYRADKHFNEDLLFQLFADAYTVPSRRLMLLYHCIIIETIFGENDTEITFRIALRVANFIEKLKQEKYEVFNKVKKIYGKRSRFVHGSKIDEDDKEFLDYLALAKSYVQRTLKRLIEEKIPSRGLNGSKDLDYLFYHS